jgi:hypothetical protein
MQQTRTELQRTRVESSQIFSVGFDAAIGDIEIQFKTAKGEGGSVYRYTGKTKADFDAFVGAESLGKHFGAHIKPGPTLKREGANWAPLAQAKASGPSIDLLRKMAKEQGLWSGAEGERIGPLWRHVVTASRTNYEDDAAGALVETWLATLLQSQCSAAIEFLKAQGR